MIYDLRFSTWFFSIELVMTIVEFEMLQFTKWYQSL